MLVLLFALDLWPGLTTGIILALVLAAVLWGPYLYKEIRRGKVQEGPRTPVGAGDTHPGSLSDPARGRLDGEGDPYDPQTRR